MINVSQDGLFTLDGGLVQDVTVGDFADQKTSWQISGPKSE
jgi:hypothetical protein